MQIRWKDKFMKNEKEKFREDWFGPQFMSKMQIGLVAVCHLRSKSRGHSKAKCQIHSTGFFSTYSWGYSWGYNLCPKLYRTMMHGLNDQIEMGKAQKEQIMNVKSRFRYVHLKKQMTITFLSTKTFYEHGQNIELRVVAAAKSSIGWKLHWNVRSTI